MNGCKVMRAFKIISTDPKEKPYLVMANDADEAELKIKESMRGRVEEEGCWDIVEIISLDYPASHIII